MNKESDIKELIREKYSEIATQEKEYNLATCCGATCACHGEEVYTIMADDYTQLEGYVEDADLGLGCGLPTEFAKIKEGDTVIDLGSGAGNDVFIARRITGEKGKVIGIDFTEPMIERARTNADKLGYNNVEFRFGDIEKIPVTANVADVVVSNCVLNLVPDKQKVFNEIYRVLKAGAHFSISDIVLNGEMPERWKEVSELYAGCVSGAVQKSEYLDMITRAGFKAITLQKQKPILIPEEILEKYLTRAEIEEYLAGKVQIESITVYAEKPCCTPGSGCC